MSEQQEIGQRLLLYRRKHKMNQAEMADAISVSRNYVSMIERGEAINISMNVYLKICDIIGYPSQKQDNLHDLFVEMYTAYCELAGVHGCDPCLDGAEKWRRRYMVITGHAMQP